MVDVVDKATRSRMMSGIRGKDTKPELLVRKGLHALGFRFRLYAKDVPGKPDIVLPKYRALVVVHGCFWHGHGCRYFKNPKSNSQFWESKISANRARDARNAKDQLDKGWRVLVVWECAVRRSVHENDFDVAGYIAAWLLAGYKTGFIDESGMHFT